MGVSVPLAPGDRVRLGESARFYAMPRHRERLGTVVRRMRGSSIFIVVLWDGRKTATPWGERYLERVEV